MSRQAWPSPGTIAALTLLVVATSGCILGRSLATVEPAHSPMGITVAVRALTGSTFRGELLALTDSGLLMLVEDRIAFVYGDAIDRVQPRSGAAGFYVAGRELRTIPAAQHLVPLSRFPAGVAEPVLGQLLTTCSQRLPELVRAPRSR